MHPALEPDALCQHVNISCCLGYWRLSTMLGFVFFFGQSWMLSPCTATRLRTELVSIFADGVPSESIRGCRSDSGSVSQF